jgi:hypothetical protein
MSIETDSLIKKSIKNIRILGNIIGKRGLRNEYSKIKKEGKMSRS